MDDRSTPADCGRLCATIVFVVVAVVVVVVVAVAAEAALDSLALAGLDIVEDILGVSCASEWWTICRGEDEGRGRRGGTDDEEEERAVVAAAGKDGGAATSTG